MRGFKFGGFPDLGLSIPMCLVFGISRFVSGFYPILGGFPNVGGFPDVWWIFIFHLCWIVLICGGFFLIVGGFSSSSDYEQDLQGILSQKVLGKIKTFLENKSKPHGLGPPPVYLRGMLKEDSAKGGIHIRLPVHCLSGKRREHKDELFGSGRPPGGVGVFHSEGWGSKSSCPPSKFCLP